MKSRMNETRYRRHIFLLFPVFNQRKWHSMSVSAVSDNFIPYLNTIVATRRTEDVYGRQKAMLTKQFCFALLIPHTR